MAIGASSHARVTQNMVGASALSNFTMNNSALFKTQQQLSTGRRILQTSMDAQASTRFLSSQSRTVRTGDYLNTIADISQSYQLVDSQISEAVDLVNTLKQIAIKESDDASSDTETRALAASEVNNLRNTLLDIANMKFNGMNLFGGKNTTGTAFSTFGDATIFNGTLDVNQRFIDDGVGFNASMSAATLFGDLETMTAARRDLNASLDIGVVSPTGQPQVSTPLDALNGGRGVDLGIVNVHVYPDGASNPASGRSYEVDLRDAKTISDVAVAFNNVRGADGNPVFDVTTYEGAGTTFPQDGSNRITGLQVTAIGEAATAIAGRPSEIQFQSEPGRRTAEDLGLISGSINYQTTTSSLIPAFGTNQGDTAVGGTFNQTYDFDLNVNGRTLNISVTPTGAQDLADFASELQTQIDSALNTAGLYDFNVAVSTDAVNSPDQLIFDVTDDSGTGSFEIVAAAGASVESSSVEDAFATGSLTQNVSFNQAAGSLTGGFFAGRDLNPALSIHSSLATLNGGEGLILSQADSGGVPANDQPQGLRITNGSLSADIDLSDLVNDPTKTVGDLLNRINNSGVQVDARISEDGDRIEIASKLTGVELRVENLNGSIGSQLGIDTRFQEMRLDDLNDGAGLTLSDGADFRATTSTGIAIEFDVGDPQTVDQLISSINTNANNVDPVTGNPAFTAKAVTERKFETTTLAAGTLNAAASFQISLNGGPARSITVNNPPAALTLDQMAAQLETELQNLATEQGLSDYTVRVNADSASGRLQFEVEDADGPAAIDFIGGATSAFGLDGTLTGQGERVLTNESVTHRFTLEDNTFDSANFQPGDTLPVLQNLGTSSILEDMGITTSDAVRRQAIGTDVSSTITLPLAATSFDVTLPRGQTFTVNLGGEATLDAVATSIETAMRAAIAAEPIEGMRASVRIDSASGGLMIETFDAYGDGLVQLSNSVPANGLTDLGLDSTQLNSGTPSAYVFNFDTTAFEGTGHSLRGESADNVFTAMNELVSALQSDNPIAVANTLNRLDTSLNQFLHAQSDSGSNVRRLDLATNRLENEQLNLSDLMSRDMDIDFGEAATRLQREEATLQASLNVFTRIFSLTALDYLR